MIYALCRKIDFVENLRVFGVKIWTEISIRVKNLTFSMSAQFGLIWRKSESFVCDQEQTAQLDVALKKIGSAAQVLLIMIVIKN